MTFGEERGWGAAKEDSRKVYDAFRQAGGNFIECSCNAMMDAVTIASLAVSLVP